MDLTWTAITVLWLVNIRLYIVERQKAKLIRWMGSVNWSKATERDFAGLEYLRRYAMEYWKATIEDALDLTKWTFKQFFPGT